MQSGWRLYAVMIGLAALTGTIVALALSGGPRLPSESPRRETPAATSFATATSSPTRSPSTQASPTPTATPTPLAIPSGAEPLTRIRPLVFAWRPTETTAIAEKLTDSGTRLIAVPLSGGTVTPLVDLPAGTVWHLRLDGSAIAMTVQVGTTTLPRTRIAALNFQTGALGWVTPDETSAQQRSPRWSNDGTVVYYTRTSSDGLSDLGVYRVRVDGSNLTQLRAATDDRAVDVMGLTPDGVGLVLSKSQEGGSLDILDLNTRLVRSRAAGGFVESWRPQRPRALVSVGGPAVGRTQLVVWDDQVPANAGTAIVTQSLVFGADWDPTATRLVTAMSSGIIGTAPPQLVTMDPNGQNKTTLVGTDGASSPYWLRAGIVYLYATSFARPSEVRLAQPTGTAAPKTLYGATDIIRLAYVSP